jgi:hypothetical protein
MVGGHNRRDSTTADAFWTAADIPDRSGRVAVLTGANTGLGLETARELARKGAGRAVKLLTPLTQSAAMGALPTLRAATDPSAAGGKYYGPDGFLETGGHPVLVESSARSHDTRLQQELWDHSEAATGVSYPL